MLRQGNSDNGPLATRQKRIRSTKQLRSTAARRVDITLRRHGGSVVASGAPQKKYKFVRSARDGLQICPTAASEQKLQDPLVVPSRVTGICLSQKVLAVVAGCRLWRFCVVLVEVVVSAAVGSGGWVPTRPSSRSCRARPEFCVPNRRLGRCLASPALPLERGMPS